MAFIHIVFVGHHREHHMSSIKRWLEEYPPRKFILILGKQETTGELIAEKIAKEMLDLLSPLYEVAIERIDELDITEAVNQLLEIVASEGILESEFLINISRALPVFSVIAYIVACLIQSKLVSVIPRYATEGNETGIEKHVEIPILPRFTLGHEQSIILTAIGRPGIPSVDILVKKVFPKSKESKKRYVRERAKVAYYLDILEGAGFIVRTKKGKTARVDLTDLGRIFTQQNYNRGRIRVSN